jgi:RNA-directed DNA polymerase
MSAERSARSVSHAEGVDPVRALQRVLYRSAKQHPTRRFHAVYDKVARSDILWQAWVDVVGVRMRCDERCRRAVCGRTARTVR